MGRAGHPQQTPESRRKELYDLYLRRTDRINDWNLVDISAHQVVGGYLVDKPRDVLYQLARSRRWWERRIAMFATMAFVRNGDLGDTFALAGLLVHDDHDLVRKVVGGMLREAGKHEETDATHGVGRPQHPRRGGPAPAGVSSSLFAGGVAARCASSGQGLQRRVGLYARAHQHAAAQVAWNMANG